MLDKNQSLSFPASAKDSDFALIPKQLIPTTQLSLQQKLVLGILFIEAQKQALIFPTHEEFADELNLPKKEIFMAIKSLKKMGILAGNFSKKTNQKNHEFIIFSRQDKNSSRALTAVGSYIILNLTILNLIFKDNIKSSRRELNNVSHEKNIHKNKQQTSAKKQKSPESKLINYWNSLPNTRKHYDKTSKVYCNIMKYFRAMKNGTFEKLCKLDEGYSYKNKKWLDEEIMKAMHNVALLFTEGYWPPDKSKLPKALDVLLYNSYSRKSLFHQFAENPPSKNASKLDVMNEFSSLFDSLSLSEMKKLDVGIKSIKIFFNRMPTDKSGQIDYWFSSFEKFCDSYTTWLQTQDWINEIYVGTINTSSKLWRKFIDAQEQEFGIRLQ